MTRPFCAQILRTLLQRRVFLYLFAVFDFFFLFTVCHLTEATYERAELETRPNEISASASASSPSPGNAIRI